MIKGKLKFSFTSIKNADGSMSVNAKPSDPTQTGRFSVEVPKEETEAQEFFDSAVNKDFLICIEKIDEEEKETELESNKSDVSTEGTKEEEVVAFETGQSNEELAKEKSNEEEDKGASESAEGVAMKEEGKTEIPHDNTTQH